MYRKHKKVVHINTNAMTTLTSNREKIIYNKDMAEVPRHISALKLAIWSPIYRIFIFIPYDFIIVLNII